jgi:ribosome-associated translation inhibitor RaiA
LDEIREVIQKELNTISNVESGVPVPDDIVEAGKTYFGYELQQTYISSDDSRNYITQINITGRVVRKNDTSENTLKIIDTIAKEIITHLKKLNFKCDDKDISLENNIRKKLITGYVKYDEMNKRLVF